MKKLRAGVVGVGSLGQHHARIYSELADVELVALVDLQEDRVDELAKRFACRSETDFESILSEVDLISLAVPTRSHAEIALRSMEAGVHVLVEKPIAASREEAERMIRARDEAGVILQVGHTERFNPVTVAIRPLVTTPQFFETHRLGIFVPRSLDIDVVLDLMVHDLDLVLWMVKRELKEIRAVGIPVLTPRVDIANVRLEFEGGCVANLTASRVSRERVRKMRFFQPHDYVSLDFQEKSIEMFHLEESVPLPKIVEKAVEVHDREPLAVEIEAFVSSVRGSSSLLSCSAEDALAALDLAEEIVRQIAEHPSPWSPPGSGSL